jgi:hypothetical protein
LQLLVNLQAKDSKTYFACPRQPPIRTRWSYRDTRNVSRTEGEAQLVHVRRQSANRNNVLTAVSRADPRQRGNVGEVSGVIISVGWVSILGTVSGGIGQRHESYDIGGTYLTSAATGHTIACSPIAVCAGVTPLGSYVPKPTPSLALLPKIHGYRMSVRHSS